MKSIRASRIAALFLVIFMIISLLPSSGLAEEIPEDAAPVADSLPADPPAEPEEQVEAQSVEETEEVQEEFEDESVPADPPVEPEEQVQDRNMEESAQSDLPEPAEESAPAGPQDEPEEQVQAQGVGDAEEEEESEPDDLDDSPDAFSVKLADFSCVYDGNEHWNENAPECELSGEETTPAYAFSFEEEGEYTADLASLKKTDAGEYTIFVKATNQSTGEEAKTTSKLIITKREVSVKADDFTTEYTGDEVHGSEVYVFEGLAEGHLATVSYEPATGTEAGTYDNGSFDEDSFKVIVKPEKEDDTSEDGATVEEDGENEPGEDVDTPETVVTSNYTLKEMTPGILVIEERAAKIEISISSADETWTYDGYEHSKPVYTVLCSGEVVLPADESGLVFTLPQTGDTLTVLEPAKVKDVSDTAENNNTFSYELTNTDLYHVEKNAGTLTMNYVDQATVTITGNSDTKTYSGSAQSISGYEYLAKSGETVIPNTEFIVELAADKEAKAEGINTGTYAMGLVKDNFTVTNPNCKSISVEYTDGYLTIQQMHVKVTVTGHTNKSVYDGKEHSVSGYDVECSESLYAQNSESNISFTGNAYAARINVSSPSAKEGTTYMGLNSDQFQNKNSNFNVQFEVVDGYQTIERRRLVVTTGGGEKVYDGTPLKNAEATLTGLVEGETATVTASGEQTDAGESRNVYEIKWGTARVGNYVVAVTRGLLRVTRAPLTIKVRPQSYPYNGKAQGENKQTYTDPKVISEKVEVKGLQGKDKLLSITLDGQQAEIGTYEKEKGIALSNVVIGTDPKSSTNSIKNYTVRWSRGTLTIKEADSDSSSHSSSVNSRSSSHSGGSSHSGSSSHSSGSSSGYDYGGGYNYTGGYNNPSNTAQAENAVESYAVPLDIGGISAGTGESYE